MNEYNKKHPIRNFVKNLVMPVYKKTSIYKLKYAKIEKEKKLLEYLSQGGCKVLNGPFEGMRYITETIDNTILPKIVGSYEEVLHEIINDIISEKKYDTIVDIGCAEGYYATGFALKMPEVKVNAFDINTIALESAILLAKLNAVENVVFKPYCSHRELNELCSRRALVFCDIEGDEKTLLEPSIVENLKYADMIIESHDCFRPGISEELIRRFQNSHIIKILVDYPFRCSKYSIPESINPQDYKYLYDEKRRPLMKFLYMKSVTKLPNQF